MDSDFEDFDNSSLTAKNLFEGAVSVGLNESINTTLNNLQYNNNNNNNNNNGFGMGHINDQQHQQYYQQQQQQQHIDPFRSRGGPTPGGGLVTSSNAAATDDPTTTQQPAQQQQQQLQQQQQAATSTSVCTPQPILDTIYKLLSDQETSLVNMIHDQSIVLNRLTQPLDEQSIVSLQSLSQQQVTMSNQMHTEMSALDSIKKGKILDPTDLAKMFALKQDLQTQFKQLTLLHQEVQGILNPSSQTSKPNVCLVVKTQPFPVVITKGKQLSENQLVVQILTGARLNFNLHGPVKATLICDSSPSSKSNPTQQLEMDSQPIYPANLTAHFPLKFLAGTRKSSVNLKFGVNIRDMDNMTTAVESDASNPFVVITNECQWEGSAGVLLKKDAFDGQLEIPWPQFINTLQRHFLIATKQDPVRPKRPLSQFDFKYIQVQFFAGRTLIHQQDFDKFWNWFGKSMQTLRYQRHISALWQEGIIYGYMDRQESDNALAGQDPGTFIIRFSERNPGQFGIAYIGTEMPYRIKHYLVQPNDTAAAKKTFPDFLAEHPQFINILQWTKGPDGQPRFLKCHKDSALGSFAPKKVQPTPVGGYEPLGMH
ncbi:hypothetical protein SAMD00019534_050770 [Acytostelium subglobosum LB1]|uniref:hypothetical protein n=1 Tax=Acytostelium subglobosum LB1 TaxID=1410327 RepID=UPI000644DBD7|nr:hypothetical protein SAMD00019534_050770 [Acytostelium subglobosum LB1]GAM21902.1 hypothetical protein SAMD00019534_050770 [Acytostelium subglobosum LB1]|eukprot:XP_012755002.1 hypothetical protein SAMD00019534_050770 [Acytostelium subglobosum LB1]